ncbi:MAG TPA: hypothetical protein VKU02_28685 [Gemmataceae bacterium]|nr:hypothetical protein [Gemmataceae bacterium]
MKWTFRVALGGVLASITILAVVFLSRSHQRAALAQAQVDRWAEQLHGQTTPAGVYIRYPANQLPEADPWGTPLNVAYAQGGFAETLTVRSAGPDGLFYTPDDLVARRCVVNLQGIGRGAKDGVEGFAHNAARGLTKGAAEGIRETLQQPIGAKKSADQNKQDRVP